MSEAAGKRPVRRGRGGGGAARRAARTARHSGAAPAIMRAIPDLDILGEEALQIIEHNAETVLEEIGVAFVDNPAALA
ncbi:MAG TPA: trimethylamine methyltransferase, partial [Rhodobacterales bacterium]|nr:trimethylamine methyltransferase [Rhodobacterales bacterium]